MRKAPFRRLITHGDQDRQCLGFQAARGLPYDAQFDVVVIGGCKRISGIQIEGIHDKRDRLSRRQPAQVQEDGHEHFLSRLEGHDLINFRTLTLRSAGWVFAVAQQLEHERLVAIIPDRNIVAEGLARIDDLEIDLPPVVIEIVVLVRADDDRFQARMGAPLEHIIRHGGGGATRWDGGNQDGADFLPPHKGNPPVIVGYFYPDVRGRLVALVAHHDADLGVLATMG